MKHVFTFTRFQYVRYSRLMSVFLCREPITYSENYGFGL